jgi:hypothetical protein
MRPTAASERAAPIDLPDMTSGLQIPGESVYHPPGVDLRDAGWRRIGKECGLKTEAVLEKLFESPPDR